MESAPTPLTAIPTEPLRDAGSARGGRLQRGHPAQPPPPPPLPSPGRLRGLRLLGQLGTGGGQPPATPLPTVHTERDRGTGRSGRRPLLPPPHHRDQPCHSPLVMPLELPRHRHRSGPPALLPVPSACPQQAGSAPSQAQGVEGDRHTGGGLGEQRGAGQRGPGDAEHAGDKLGFLRAPPSPPLLTPPGWGISALHGAPQERETCLEQLPPTPGTTPTPPSRCRAGQHCRAPL